MNWQLSPYDNHLILSFSTILLIYYGFKQLHLDLHIMCFSRTISLKLRITWSYLAFLYLPLLKPTPQINNISNHFCHNESHCLLKIVSIKITKQKVEIAAAFIGTVTRYSTISLWFSIISMA